MADTLAAQIAETTQELIAATYVQLPQNAVMMNLVTRIPVPKGKNAAEVPRENAVPTVQMPTEGDEIVTSSQYDLTSTTVTPSLRVIKVRVSERATYHSRDNLIARISAWLARAHAQDMDEDLLAEFANFHTDNDVGTTNVDLKFDVLRTARRLLQSVTPINGGPAPGPIFFVGSPVVMENLMTDMGVVGNAALVTAGFTAGGGYIPEGLSQKMIQEYMFPQNRLLGVTCFWDGYITNNGSGDHICGMFSKRAMHIAISQDWQLRTFEESNWLGPILRSRADYESGIAGYPHWGAQVTADGTA